MRMHMGKFDEFIATLKLKLDGPLPGLRSQLKMASMRRNIEGGRMKVPDNVKKGGVLVLFYPIEGEIYLVFMKRTEYPGVHSGQISFPGGGWEPVDSSIVMTALREAEEEVGIDKDTVTVIGNLSELFIPPSNFLVTPVVGYTNERPEFTPDAVEVDRILEIPLRDFLDPAIFMEKEITVYPNDTFKVPCFFCDNEVIWGATAMILNELIDLINQGSEFHK